MTKAFKEPVLGLWYEALASPYGREVECSPDFETVQQRLYAVRAEVRDPDLKEVSICRSPFDPEKLWLVRKEPSDEAA